MDLFPNGEVISCKIFPEFSVGDLKNDSVFDIWHSDKFTKKRQCFLQINFTMKKVKRSSGM
ncbi:SPASM domain-containing protein [Nostoc sp.]|uniref:SPASM domain-containing protein n=1 Tax=Nostoc sp. TaxID=1180 RepID=UPI003FA56DC2